MAQVIETKVVCKQTGRYIGWPSIARGTDGVLHALFSGDRDGHVCPVGKNYLVRSEDAGRSWSDPVLVNDTPLDDRDTGLCVCPDGTLVMSWFTSFYYGQYNSMHAANPQSGKPPVRNWTDWDRVLRAVTPEIAEKWAPHLIVPSPAESQRWVDRARELGRPVFADFEDTSHPPGTRRVGYWTRRSRDGGRTWDEPTPSPVSAPHGPNVLPDGRLIYIGVGPFKDDQGRKRMGVALSGDQGLTWKLQATINAAVAVTGADGQPAAGYLCEPHVAAAPSGKLVGLARFQAKIRGEDRNLWQFDSQDGGLTWSEPRQTNLNGFPPHLLLTADGRLLAAFSVRHEPLGFRFCFSADEGRTWDVANQLHVGTELKDHGYPATAEPAPGNFVSVYYRKDRADEKPCLMMTRWKG